MSSAASDATEFAPAPASSFPVAGDRVGPAVGIPIGGLVPVIALSFCLVVLLMSHAGLAVRIAPRAMAVVLLVGAIAGPMIWLPRLFPSAAARACGDSASFLVLFAGVCVFGALASYPIAALSNGYADAGLEHLDLLVGFDWGYWYEIVARHPALQLFERAAYANIFPIPAVILLWFAVSERRIEATRFIAAFWLAAVITLAIFYFVPSRGPFAMLLGHDTAYLPTSGLYQAQLIPELRSHRLHAIDLGALHGLVGAPSFHATSGALFIAAAWPVRALRWPVAGFGGAMLLATPIEGTHYLSDIVAGLLVALVALGATAAIEGMCRHRATA